MKLTNFTRFNILQKHTYTDMKRSLFKGLAMFASLLLFTAVANKASAQCSAVVVDKNGQEVTSAVFCENEPIQFLAKSPGYTTTVLWEYGNGDQNATQKDNKYSYANAGNYTVKFSGSGPAGSCTNTIDIEIKPSPKINFQITNLDFQCFEGNEFCFVDSTEAAAGSVYDSTIIIFSDGTKKVTYGYGDSFCFTIADPSGGFFDAAIQSIDQNGCVSRGEIKDFFYVNPKLGIQFNNISPGPNPGCDSTLGRFLNTSLIPLDSIKRFCWYWGDGDSICGDANTNTEWWDGPNGDGIVEHMYNEHGSFDGKLVVEATYDCIDSFVWVSAVTNIILRPVIVADKDSSCVPDNPVTFKLRDGFPSGVSSFLWNFGDPPSGMLNTNFRDQEASHSYGAGQWMITLNIVAGPCDITVYDTISKIGPGSTIEVAFNRVAQWETYQCEITDSIHFVNNSSFYHNDPTTLDEDAWTKYYDETYGIWFDNTTGFYYLQMREWEEDRLGNKLINTTNYPLNSTQTENGVTFYLDTVKDSFAIVYNGDTTYFPKVQDAWGRNGRVRYLFNWTVTDGSGAGNGDQTAIPPTINKRGYDPNVWRVWDMGDQYAPQCTTDSRPWVNKNVGVNCNWYIDSVPVHWYTPWDEIYKELNGGRFYTRPFTRTLINKTDTFCYTVNVYADDTMIVGAQTILTVPEDSSYTYIIRDENGDGVDTINLSPGGKSYNYYYGNHKYVIRRPPSIFVGTKVIHYPDSGYWMAINKNNDTTYHNDYRLGDDPVPLIGDGTTIWTVYQYDMYFDVPAGVTVDIVKLAGAGGGGTGGQTRSETGPKRILIEADEQFTVYSEDTIYTELTIEEIDADTSYAQASTDYETQIINGVPTVVAVQRVFYDSAAHREDFYLNRANCYNVTLWHQDTIHPLMCEGQSTKSLALNPPSARGMEWANGTPCPLNGQTLDYYLEFSFADAKPGCSQPWFAVNFDSIADPTNFVSSTGGDIFPPPAPPLMPIHAMPYQMVGNFPNSIIKGYLPGEIGNDPNLRKPKGSFTVGLIMGNGAPYNDTTWVVDPITGDTLTNLAGDGDSIIVVNYPAQCLDTFWYNDLFRILYLNSDFTIIRPGADIKTMCAGDTAWFQIDVPLQDSLAVLQWNWGYNGNGRGPLSEVYQESFHYYKKYTGPSPTRNDKDIVYNGEDWLFNYVIRQDLTSYSGLTILDTIVTAIIKDWKVVVNTTTLQAKQEVEDRFELAGLDYALIPPSERIFYLGTTNCVDTTGLSQFFTYGVEAYSHVTDAPNVYMNGDRRYRVDTTVIPNQIIEVAHILHFRDSSIQGYDTVLIDTNGNGTLDTLGGVWVKPYRYPEVIVPDICNPLQRDTIMRASNGPMTPYLYLSNTIGCFQQTAKYLNVGFINDFWLDNEFICEGLEVELDDTLRYWQYGEMDPPNWPIWKTDYWHDAARYLANKEIYEADWDSTDGQWDGERSLAALRHAYSAPGKYTVTVVPKDSMGCTDTVYLDVFITEVNPAIKLSSGFLNCVTFVDFQDSTWLDDPCVKQCPNGIPTPACDSVVRWEWDFGDGTRKSLLENPSHNYTQGGYFDVKLKVWTELGCHDSIVRRIFIPGPQPEFKFDNAIWDQNDSAVICVGDSVVLTNISGGQKIDPSYQLEWGDGAITSFGDTTHFAHVYDQVGTFEIYLIQFDEISGTNDRCSRIFPDTNPDLVTKRKIRVIVLPRAEADLAISDTIVCPNEPVMFTALVDTLYTRYIWDFGDNDTITKFKPDSTVWHSYATSGTYNVKLIPDFTPPQYIPKCVDTAYGTVQVVDVEALFEVDSSNRPQFCFVNKSTGAVSYEWIIEDVNGDVTRTEENTCYSWGNNRGTFQVCLIATSAEGCKDTFCDEVTNTYVRLIKVYNVFTPPSDNNPSDDLNDVFRIEGEGFETYNIKVFNRWGEKVFESDDINDPWNGSVNNTGAECPGGTYFYIINYKFLFGEENEGLGPIEGVVELIR